MSVTDTQIEAWMTQRRKEYAAGTLPQWKINRLEKIPGWEWGVDPPPAPTASHRWSPSTVVEFILPTGQYCRFCPLGGY
jgi:hypothetical protein